MDTEKNEPENAGDQDENATAPPDLITPEVAPLVERYLASTDAAARAAIAPTAPACELTTRGEEHDRHVFGPASAPVHCPGWSDPADVVPTYVQALQDWRAANPWSATYGTLIHHAQVLARKLDRAGDDAPAALSSAYLQAISRLERMRPGAPAEGDDGDGLNPPGRQPSLFDPID